MKTKKEIEEIDVDGWEKVSVGPPIHAGRDLHIEARAVDGGRLVAEYGRDGDGLVYEDTGAEIHGFEKWDKLTDELFRVAVQGRLTS